MILHSQAEACHYSGTDAAGYRQRDQPRYDNVAEDGPVDVLARSESSDKHDRSDLAVCGADGHADVRRNQHRQRRADLDTETTATKPSTLPLIPTTRNATQNAQSCVASIKVATCALY